MWFSQFAWTACVAAIAVCHIASMDGIGASSVALPSVASLPRTASVTPPGFYPKHYSQLPDVPPLTDGLPACPNEMDPGQEDFFDSIVMPIMV